MKKWIIPSLYSLIVILLFTIVGLLSFNAGKKKSKVIAVDFTVNEESEENGTWAYPFLKKELSDYICGLCNEMEINPDLIVAILMVENPDFDPEAINRRNANGTIDVGMFQLNDKYLWTTFKTNYWFDNIELDPFNWKHNSYIAIHHIKYLQDKLKIEDDVILAYNGGEGAVMNGNVRPETYNYLSKVKLNLQLLRRGDEE